MEKSSEPTGWLLESDMFDECKGLRWKDSFETAPTLLGTGRRRRRSNAQRLNAEVAFEVAAIPDSSDRCLGDEDTIVSSRTGSVTAAGAPL